MYRFLRYSVQGLCFIYLTVWIESECEFSFTEQTEACGPRLCELELSSACKHSTEIWNEHRLREALISLNSSVFVSISSIIQALQSPGRLQTGCAKS